jgi:hypothetical protein
MTEEQHPWEQEGNPIIGRQFIHLYRGFAGREINDLSSIDVNQLGRHWTSKKSVAVNFAGQMAGMSQGWSGVPVNGIIAYAKVPVKYVRRIIVPEHEDLEQINEHEHRVAPGTPIEVMKLHVVEINDGKIMRVIHEDPNAPRPGRA